jgi:Helix-turn-helix domain
MVKGERSESEGHEAQRSALDQRAADPPCRSGDAEHPTTQERTAMMARTVRPRLEFAASGELPMLMTTKEVAAFLRVHPSTVVRWRQVGEGPPVIWVAPTIPRYARAQVVEWLRLVAA